MATVRPRLLGHTVAREMFYIARLMSRLELAHEDDVLLDSWVKLKHTKPNS